ncbi:AAA family ATPase [Cetobacterium somerae]|uniref:AAA family ATPase n=1 Tax=Cetobacterium somerae TaxID=188913 RepID=UPI00248ECAA3|nr:AAA family ATPase [Cetobacterium somerae]
MFNLNKLYIKILDEEENEYGTEIVFNSGLNVIIGINDTGKSTIINAIYYCLGMEELLKDGRNIKALKPALRKEILVGNKNIKIKNSDIFLEIINDSEEIITLKRNVISNQGISGSMITVFDTPIQEIDISKGKDYFLQTNSATHEKGFYKFFEGFLGIKLPNVLNYDGDEVKLYLQTIFSAFFIEQIKGWTDFLATIPTYYGIKEVKQKAIEFILGLDKNEVLLKRKKLEKEKEEETIKWKVNRQILENLLRNYLIELEGNVEKYNDYDYSKVKVFIKKINSKLPIAEYIRELNENLIKLKNKNYNISEDEVNNIFIKIEEIQKRLVIYQEEQRRLEKEVIKICLQKEAILKDLNQIEVEIINFKDIIKLKELGSREQYNFEKCPCCKNKIKDAFYPETINVMNASENISYLNEKKKVLLVSDKILENKKNDLDSEIKSYTIEIKKLYEEMRIFSTDLPRVSIQKNLFKEEFETNEEIERLIDVNKKINKILLDQKYIANTLVDLSKQLKDLPKNNFSKQTEEKLEELKISLLKYLNKFVLTGENIERTEISKETYLPIIDDFNIKINISASDFIRIQWAFILALAENSIFKKKIVILDEPAQQNTAFLSVKEFFKELKNKKEIQSIVTYAIDKEKPEEVIKFLDDNKIYYIYLKDKSIKKIEK